MFGRFGNALLCDGGNGGRPPHKIVVGAQDHRLSLRFYSLVPESDDQVSGFVDDFVKEFADEQDRDGMMD